MFLQFLKTMSLVQYNNGDKHYEKAGRLHRDDDLPAFECANGFRSWWVDGQRHRDHGRPAVEWPNGDKAWWVNGVNITEFRNKYMKSRKLRAEKKYTFGL